MKTLIIIRHAKSGWADQNQSDFERSLTISGILEAETMANKLKNRIPSIDYFICSTALRARSTCDKFCKIYQYPSHKVEYSDQLYHAPESLIHAIIAAVSNEHNIITVVCHNPGITEFVNQLTQQVKIDNMPTSGVFAVEANCEAWTDFEKATKKFLFFDYPSRQ